MLEVSPSPKNQVLDVMDEFMMVEKSLNWTDCPTQVFDTSMEPIGRSWMVRLLDEVSEQPASEVATRSIWKLPPLGKAYNGNESDEVSPLLKSQYQLVIEPDATLVELVIGMGVSEQEFPIENEAEGTGEMMTVVSKEATHPLSASTVMLTV